MLVPKFSLNSFSYSVTIFDSDMMSKVLAWKQINISVEWPTCEKVVLSLHGMKVNLYDI